MTAWEAQGREFINCNCAYGCPCQFNALPTHGFCEAIASFVIDKGHYGDVSLDGLKGVMLVKWPGPIHEGKGKCQLVIDSSADSKQRRAMLQIMSGKDSDPFATVFAVFATTFDEVFDPIFAPIDLEVDVDTRRGRLHVENVVEMEGQPIRNPMTGGEHRVRIDLPGGFEYEIAEIGSATGRAQAKVPIELHETYAQFAHIHLNNHGVVRHRKSA